MKLDVEQLAARWVLGRMPSSEIPNAAVQALVDGYDGPALRELAGEVNPALSKVGRVFERALGELNAPHLSRRDSALALARQYAEQIVAGTAKPYEAAKHIWSLQLEVPEVEHALDPFVYWASEFEEAADPDREEYCTEAIVASARELGGV